MYALLLFIIVLSTCLADSFHGGTFFALAGSNSVLLASDTRFSSSGTGPYRIGQHHRFVFRIGKKCLVGCFGLDSDARELYHHVQRQLKNLEPSDVHPKSVARLISNYLYKHRLYCTPIVVGLGDMDKPYICCMDGLGAQTVSDTYAVVGTASDLVLGLCESTYQANLDPQQLVTMTENILKISLERDVLSGGQVNLLSLTSDGIFQKDIETSDV